MKKILILNGPNLNLIGIREPEIYGNKNFDQYLEELKSKFTDLELNYYQSNHEGDLIDQIQQVGFSWAGIVLNAGGYTHTSIAIRDAVKMISCPVVEVHISNIHKRESFRKHSFLTEVCQHHVIGKGLAGYDLAIQWIQNQF